MGPCLSRPDIGIEMTGKNISSGQPTDAAKNNTVLNNTVFHNSETADSDCSDDDEDGREDSLNLEHISEREGI